VRVLAVDDDVDLLLLYRVTLESDGHEVAEATTGPDALEAARAGNFEIVLLDMMLPGLDGFEVLTALGDDPLTKPFSIERLRSLVASIGSTGTDELHQLRADALARISHGR